MAIEKIILLGHDLVFRKNLEHQLSARGYEIIAAATSNEVLQYVSREHFDLAFVDVNFDDRSSDKELLKAIQSLPAHLPCVVTAHAPNVASAIAAIRGDVFDFLVKPFSAEQIGLTLRKAEEFVRLSHLNRFLSHSDTDCCELLGDSSALKNLRQAILQVARTQATVLIQGESGSGKELVARAIHRQSSRASAPFIRVDCAGTPEDLLARELFGHERTNPPSTREGCFELARGGTILLDEIHHISPVMQSHLLRVLQEREVQPVGNKRPINVDVRIIATTNRALEQSVERKTFRQDLYFRLNVLPLVVPPLRERLEDISILAEAFVRLFSRKHGTQMQSISRSARAALSHYQWPGNVRELRNVIERAVILGGNGDTLEPEHLTLPPTPSSQTAEFAQVAQTSTATIGSSFASLAELEKQHILAALQRCKGNRTHAARLLDISIRTLRNKLHEYNGTTPRPAPKSGSTPAI